MDADRPEDAGPLVGEVALVTGGGRGIGRGIARGLATAGATVAVLARTGDEVERTAAGIRTAGGQAEPITCDVTDRRQVEAAIDTVEQVLGPLTIVVNNAGTCHAVGPVGVVDPDDWWREVEIHVRGSLLVSHHALERMVPRGRGRIVNIYGNLGDQRGAYSSAYAVAKASLLRLTEQMAIENAGSGIVVLALHPGLVHTRMIDELASEDAREWLPRFSRIQPDEFMSEEVSADAVTAIATGAADALNGRYLRAWEDLASVVEASERIASRDERVLRITGL